MATSAMIRGIQPTQRKERTPSPSPASTPSSTPPSTPPPRQAEGDQGEKYYDIMIVGLTGQGKTTTSDKMVIARTRGMDMRVLAAKDLSLWTVSRTPKDLKRGYFEGHKACQALDDPQKYLDDFRRELNLNRVTTSCQLVSNDLTKLRILDVPGFFSDDEVQGPLVQPSSLLENDIHKFTCSHLAIMRDILRVQSTMRMKFRRILYFLPVKGPLVRSNMVLRQELILLARYFGRSIFECMVLVATVQSRFSQMKALQGELFTEDEGMTTKLAFQNTLEGILASYPVGDGDGSTPCPPVVFISLLDTGEDIVDMVKRAQVRKDHLELKFEPGICIKCPCTINWLENEKVEVIPSGNGEGPIIPYSDSVCHPIFLPRGRRPHRVVVEEGTRWIELSLNEAGHRRGERADEEICHNCQEPPGTKGCLRVGVVYSVAMHEGEDEKIVVDHTNYIERHRALVQKKHVLPDNMEGERELAGTPGRQGLREEQVPNDQEEEGQVPEDQEGEWQVPEDQEGEGQVPEDQEGEGQVPEGKDQGKEGQIPDDQVEVQVHENRGRIPRRVKAAASPEDGGAKGRAEDRVEGGVSGAKDREEGGVSRAKNQEVSDQGEDKAGAGVVEAKDDGNSYSDLVLTGTRKTNRKHGRYTPLSPDVSLLADAGLDILNDGKG